MDPYLFVAGCLAIAVGLIHSFLGERLIFGRMRDGGVVPTKGRPLLRESHVRILWATWHLASVFGWGLGAILLWHSSSSLERADWAFVEKAILFSMLSGAGLVLVGTRGKHPGWVVLLAIAVLLGIR